jgi:hypothetical protein
VFGRSVACGRVPRCLEHLLIERMCCRPTTAGFRRTRAELSFKTVTRRGLTVTEASSGFVRSARRTGGSGLGSLRELCEVELVPVDGGREIEHGGSDQAEQSRRRSRARPERRRMERRDCCEPLEFMRVPFWFFGHTRPLRGRSVFAPSASATWFRRWRSRAACCGGRRRGSCGRVRMQQRRSRAARRPRRARLRSRRP